MDPLLTETLEILRVAADPARAEKMRAYAPTTMEHLGVDAKTTKAAAASINRRLRAEKAPLGQTLAFALSGARSGVFDLRQVGIEVLAKHRKAHPLLDRPTLEALGEGMDNWVTVDALSCWVAGAALKLGVIDDAVLVDWSRSDDRWWRRAALVTTTALNRLSGGGTGQAERTLAICDPLAGDRDDMVAKGMSWALRSVVPHDPDGARRFLREHAAILPARVRREVRNKLDTGKKNR